MFTVRRCVLNHSLNPLHLMCRLYKLGLSLNKAKRVCRYYEITIYIPLNRLLVGG